MIKQLLAQITQGFSVKDVPFFVLQLVIAALLAWIIRLFWRKSKLSEEENQFLKLLIPVQIVFTVIAVFSLKSPWIIVLFGFLALIPLLGASQFSIKSKVFYLLCLFISFGCGASNMAITVFVFFVFICPVLYFNSGNHNE